MQLDLEVRTDGKPVFGLYSDGNVLLKLHPSLIDGVRGLLLRAAQYLEAILRDGDFLPGDSVHVDSDEELNNVIASVISGRPTRILRHQDDGSNPERLLKRGD